MDMKVKETPVVISAPKFNTVEVMLQGTAPLVVARFSNKAGLMAKMAEGKSAGSKKVRDARDYDKEAEDARYRSSEGWEGVNAAAFRAVMQKESKYLAYQSHLLFLKYNPTLRLQELIYLCLGKMPYAFQN